MPVKSKRVELSFIPAHVEALLDFGKMHGMQTWQGALKIGVVCRKIIDFMLRLYKDEDVNLYLKEHGGTLFDLILRAVKKYISEN